MRCYAYRRTDKNHFLDMKNIGIISITLLFSIVVTTNKILAQVAIEEPYIITSRLAAYKSERISKEDVRAWRVQFLYTDDRRKLDQEVRRIKNEFPKIDVQWHQRTPYYFVTGGAFEKELEALQFLQNIKDNYPGALAVREDIPRQEMLRIIENLR